MEDEKLLQIVLVGRPVLEQRLKSPELQSVTQRVALWCRLEPLTAGEVGTYIDRRLSRAGCRRQGLFERAAVEQIAVYSAGIPRLINVICDNALLSTYHASRKTVSVETVHKVFRSIGFEAESERHPAPSAGESLDCPELPEAEFKTATDSDARVMGDQQGEFRPVNLSDTHHQPLPQRPVRSRLRVRRAIFSRSTLATVVGSLLMAATVAMLTTDRHELSRKPVESVSISQPTDEPRGGDVPEQAADEGPAYDKLQMTTSGALGPDRSRESDAVVYVHVSEPRDRPLIDEIGGALRQNGYSARNARFAPGQTQGDVRFFFVEDRREAEKIKSVVESELRRRGYPMSLRLLERDGRKFEFAAPGKIEVWLPPLPHVSS